MLPEAKVVTDYNTLPWRWRGSIITLLLGIVLAIVYNNGIIQERAVSLLEERTLNKVTSTINTRMPEIQTALVSQMTHIFQGENITNQEKELGKIWYEKEASILYVFRHHKMQGGNNKNSENMWSPVLFMWDVFGNTKGGSKKDPLYWQIQATVVNELDDTVSTLLKGVGAGAGESWFISLF